MLTCLCKWVSMWRSGSPQRKENRSACATYQAEGRARAPGLTTLDKVPGVNSIYRLLLGQQLVGEQHTIFTRLFRNSLTLPSKIVQQWTAAAVTATPQPLRPPPPQTAQASHPPRSTGTQTLPTALPPGSSSSATSSPAATYKTSCAGFIGTPNIPDMVFSRDSYGSVWRS